MVVYNVEKSKVFMLLQAYWDVKFKVSKKSVELFLNPMVSLESGKDRTVIATYGTFLLSFVFYILRNGKSGHDVNCKTFEVLNSAKPLGILGSVAYLLSGTLYQGKHDMPWNVATYKWKVQDWKIETISLS